MIKRIIILFALLLFPYSALAYEGYEQYYFHGKEFGIWLPSSFSVVHENMEDGETCVGISAQEAEGFLSDNGIDLYASYDDGNKYFLIYTLPGFFDSEAPFSDWSTLVGMEKYWVNTLDESNTLVFSEVYHSNDFDECSGFVNLAYTFVVGDETAHCLEYVTALEEDIIGIIFTSREGQFNIEEEHLAKEIVDKLFDVWVTVNTL